MEGLVYLIPAALFLGLVGLGCFLWTIKDGQYDDLEGATYRALFEEDDMAEEQKEKSRTNGAVDKNKPNHKFPL